MPLFLLLILFFSCIVSAENIQLPELGSSRSSVLTPQMEQQIGHSLGQQLKSNHRNIDDPEIIYYVRNLGNRLLEKSGENPAQYNFMLQNFPDINAFAAPGGVVTIYSGLFLATETESELASVLAHEIAHVTQRHLAQAIEKNAQMNVPMTLGVLAAILVGVSASADLGVAATTSLSAMNAQQQINFTRNNEVDADSKGMEILYNSQLNPQGMPNFFERLQQNTRFIANDFPEFLLTHPVTPLRIAQSREKANRLQQSNTTVQLNKYTDYDFIKAKTEVISSFQPQDTRQKYRRIASRFTLNQHPEYHYAYALSLLHNEQFAEATEIFKRLYHKFSSNLHIVIAYSQTLMQSDDQRDSKQAMQILQNSLQLHPYHPILSAQYNEFLIQLGRNQQAIDIANEYISKFPPRSIFYKQLAYAYSRLKQPMQSMMAQAEYYLLEKEYHNAIGILTQLKKQYSSSESLPRIEDKLTFAQNKLAWLTPKE